MLDKKVIYLDQFAVSNVYKIRSGDTLRPSHVHDFWVEFDQRDTSGNWGWRRGLRHDSIRLLELKSEALMAGEQPGFWDVEHRLRELSEHGDPLEKLAATVDFEIFRAELMVRIMGLMIRTIGLARATAAVTLANIAYNMRRWCWLDRRALRA